MKNMQLLYLLGILSLSALPISADEGNDTTDINADLQELESIHNMQKMLCDRLLIKAEDMSDLDRARILSTVRGGLLKNDGANDTALKRNSLLPASLSQALKSRTSRNDKPMEEAHGPNKSSKHATRTLYMVTTGPLRQLLPDPTSHRRHGPTFACLTATIGSPFFAALLFAYQKGIMHKSGAIATGMLLAGIIYAIIFHYHAQDDREEIVDFLKHEWPVLSKKISFPENICTLMDYLRAELLAGTLDADKMVDCMDAVQNSGANE